MPMWRCPHCGTPQAETARCWVCRRSSTSCLTCRNFRQSVAAQLGYCGLDRRRQPLSGDEIRGCWDGWPAGARAADGAGLTIRPAAGDVQRALDFVEVDGASAPIEVSGPEPSITDGVPPPSPELRWDLWGDPDR